MLASKLENTAEEAAVKAFGNTHCHRPSENTEGASCAFCKSLFSPGENELCIIMHPISSCLQYFAPGGNISQSHSIIETLYRSVQCKID